MALLKELKGSFVGGQVSPSLQNRIDLQKFSTFLKTAKNTKIQPEGGISNRAGTVFIGVGKDSTYRLTINVNVSATITINGTTYSGTSATADIEANSEYTYEVSASGYTSQSGSGILSGNSVIDVELEASSETYTFSITATPSDAVIKINGTVQSSYTGNSGETVAWEVSKEGYVKQTGSYVLNEDHTEEVTLSVVPTTATLTIVPTPSDAIVKINNVVQSSVELAINSSYTYEVSKSGYVTETGSGTITENTTLNISLILTRVELRNIIPSSPLHEVYSMTVNRNSTYRVTLAGGKGVYWYGGQVYSGGYVQFNISCLHEDVLKIISIGGFGIYNGSSTPTDYFGNGIGLYVNNECVAVAGGSGRVVQTSGLYYLYSGSGYNPGAIPTRESVGTYIYGYGYDGTTGSRSTSNLASNADGEGTMYFYGGSGYVKNHSSITNITKSRHTAGENAYAVIEYIG